MQIQKIFYIDIIWIRIILIISIIRIFTLFISITQKSNFILLERDAQNFNWIV